MAALLAKKKQTTKTDGPMLALAREISAIYKNREFKIKDLPNLDELEPHKKKFTAAREKFLTSYAKGDYQNADKNLREFFSKFDSIGRACFNSKNTFATKGLVFRKMPVTTVAGALAELRSLKRAYPNVVFGKNRMSAVTDQISLVGQDKVSVDLGKMEIVVSIGSHLVENAEIKIQPTPESKLIGKTYLHPHVANGNLCLGEGVTAASAACREGRFVDLFDIITAVLNTYGPATSSGGRPHLSLDSWKIAPCPYCKGNGLRGELAACSRCYLSTCDKCRFQCAKCGYRVCKKCAGQKSGVCKYCK